MAGVLYVLFRLKKTWWQCYSLVGQEWNSTDKCTVPKRFQTELIIFVFLILSSPCVTMGEKCDSFTHQRLVGGGQGLWEVWRRKDNKRLAVVLYFFLQRGAPSSPSALIGSWEHPLAGRADVNRAWRTSAAGSNITTSLLPFFHPFFSLLHTHLPDLNPDHYRSFCVSVFISFC